MKRSDPTQGTTSDDNNAESDNPAPSRTQPPNADSFSDKQTQSVPNETPELVGDGRSVHRHTTKSSAPTQSTQRSLYATTAVPRSPTTRRQRRSTMRTAMPMPPTTERTTRPRRRRESTMRTVDKEPHDRVTCLPFLYGLAALELLLFAMLLTIGIWTMTHGSELLSLLIMQHDLIHNLPIWLVVVCTLGICNCLVGFTGMILHNRTLMMIYGVVGHLFMMLFVMSAGMAGHVASLGCHNDQSVMTRLRDYYINYKENEHGSHFHQIVQCCGTKTPFDMSVRVNTPEWQMRCEADTGHMCNVPLSCCRDMSDTACVDLSHCWMDIDKCTQIFQTGCFYKFPAFLCQWGIITTVVLACLASVQLINVIISCD